MNFNNLKQNIMKYTVQFSIKATSGAKGLISQVIAECMNSLPIENSVGEVKIYEEGELI